MSRVTPGVAVFSIDSAAPGRLKALSEEFVSEAAEANEFDFES